MASKTIWSRGRALRFAATTIVAALTLTLAAGVLPTAVTADAATRVSAFTSKIAESATTTKLAATAEQPLSMSFTTRTRTQTALPPVTATRTVTRTATKTTSAAGASAAAPAEAAAPAADETAQAQSILAGYIAQYPILAGASVSFGDANGYQAVAYYKSGRIVISPTHTASLSRIIGHEIWHIIDWRDNGVIDWGENVPPK